MRSTHVVRDAFDVRVDIFGSERWRRRKRRVECADESTRRGGGLGDATVRARGVCVARGWLDEDDEDEDDEEDEEGKPSSCQLPV